MTRYSRYVDGVLKNQWRSDFANEKYVEPGWGDPSTYEVLSEDITKEMADAASVEQDNVLAREDLLKTDIQNTKTLQELCELVHKMAMVLGLK